MAWMPFSMILVNSCAISSSEALGAGAWKICVINPTWRSLSASPEDQAYLQQKLDSLTPELKLDIPAAQYDFWR